MVSVHVPIGAIREQEQKALTNGALLAGHETTGDKETEPTAFVNPVQDHNAEERPEEQVRG